MQADQRFGQDCDGPFKLIIILVLGSLVSSVGISLIVLKFGWRSLKTEKVAVGVLTLSVLLLLLKMPEIIRELDYNSGAETSCSE
jgi:hypothetical protein